MAYDPIQEDCLRLILEDMRRKKVFPLENPAVIEHDMHAYQEDPARLIASDADRSFHLMTRAAELVDYRVPFINDEAEAARQDDAATDYLREATELDPSNWDAKRMLFAMEAPCNDVYVSYLLDNLPAIRSHTQALIEGAHDPYEREYASDLGQRPYLRWLGAIASRALISGQYLLSLEHAEAALEIDPADQGDLHRTALLAMAKLEWGLDDIESFTKRHALAFSHARQAPRRGGRVTGSTRVDPWAALARASVQYRSFEFEAAEKTLGALVKQYPHGAEALYYQAEFPEGVFARVNTLPGSEDELILAISEATPLLQEGYGSPDTASFSTWVSDCDVVQEALDESHAGARDAAPRRTGGGGN